MIHLPTYSMKVHSHIFGKESMDGPLNVDELDLFFERNLNDYGLKRDS